MLTHLVAPPLPPSAAGDHAADAYLLLDVARAGLTVNWAGAGARLRSRLFADTVHATMLSGDDLQQLCATLEHLVAVVDRSVQRVPLDRITYPCLVCQDRTCRDGQTEQQRPTIADDGDRTRVRDDNDHDDDLNDSMIPHIDSDPEDSATAVQSTDDNDRGELA